MIELVRITDIEELMKWRKEVIENVFSEVPGKSLLESNREYYERHIPAGTHVAFKALYCGEEAGSGSLCLSDELPSPDNPTGHCAYLMNIYVRNPFRQHGIGHAIVKRLVREAKENNCGKVYLETTDAGRGVYESLGFRDMPDMMKLGKDERDRDRKA